MRRRVPPTCRSEKRNVEMTRKTAKKRDYMIYYAIQYAIRAKTPEYSRFPGFSLCFASRIINPINRQKQHATRRLCDEKRNAPFLGEIICQRNRNRRNTPGYIIGIWTTATEAISCASVSAAARLGITQQTLSKHERGVRTPQHFKTIRGYERELKTPARALFPDIFID